MLEIPEAHTITRQASVLVGRMVTSAEAAHSPHGFAFYTAQPEDYAHTLTGRRIDGVRAHAGMVEFLLGDWRLVFSEGARLRLLPPAQKRPVKHQLLLELDDGSALVCTVQMYAGISLLLEGQGEANPYYYAARHSPSPLTDAFTIDIVRDLAADAPPSLSAKALITTERRISGLGNGCSHDILFTAGINPRRRVSTLEDADVDRLHRTIVDVLRSMADAGGRDTEKDLYDQPGGYRTRMCSKSSELPCPQCGGHITKETFLGGKVYYCPACQPISPA